MQSPVRDYLTEVLDSLDAERGGAVADYIPDLCLLYTSDAADE